MTYTFFLADMKNEQLEKLLERLEQLISGGTVVNVQIINIENIEQATFKGAYRAMARFHEPTDETEIDKVDRLYKDGISWKRIVHQVYYPDIEIDEIPEMDSEIRRVQAAHRRAYPESYEKKRK
jgi:hypothetical protein